MQASPTFSSAAMCLPVHFAPLLRGRSMQSRVACDIAPQLQHAHTCLSLLVHAGRKSAQSS